MTQFEISSNNIQPLDGQRLISINQLVQNVWNLGLITYGGPMSHIGVLRQVFVIKMKTISQQRFTQLLTICQSLPGPTSTQLLIASSIYSVGSVWAGFIAFILFSLPSFVVMFFSAIYLHGIAIDTSLGKILMGFRVVSVGIILQAFWGLSPKYRAQTKYICLFLLSACVFILFQQTLTILILFLFGGLFSLWQLKQDSLQNKLQPHIKQERFQGKWFGNKNIFFFIIGLIISLLIGWAHTDIKLLNIFSVFYKIGSIVIGGGHVILPMMKTQFAATDYFTEEDYWNGFSIISCMPGPMFNLSVYIGALITKNIFGALVAFIGLYLPCFMFILFILPHWEKYRKLKKVSGFINGMCCVSVGLILAACIILWWGSCFNKSYFVSIYYTGIIITCFMLLQKFKLQIVLVLLIGQGLFLLSQLFK